MCRVVGTLTSFVLVFRAFHRGGWKRAVSKLGQGGSLFPRAGKISPRSFIRTLLNRVVNLSPEILCT